MNPTRTRCAVLTCAAATVAWSLSLSARRRTITTRAARCRTADSTSRHAAGSARGRRARARRCREAGESGQVDTRRRSRRARRSTTSSARPATARPARATARSGALLDAEALRPDRRQLEARLERRRNLHAHQGRLQEHRHEGLREQDDRAGNVERGQLLENVERRQMTVFSEVGGFALQLHRRHSNPGPWPNRVSNL